MTVVKILFLAANPLATSPLRVNEEIRAIDEALRSADFRDNFEVKQYFALRHRDLQELLLRYRPDIVHFSGHGSKSGEIIIQNDTDSNHSVSARALGELFRILKDNIRCVVLNACYSELQAQKIAQHIDAVVGMSDQISDEGAISFSMAFYQALGFGRNVKTAFELACNQIDLTHLEEKDVPRLITSNTDPNQIVFAFPTFTFTPDTTDSNIGYGTNKSSLKKRYDFYQHISLPQRYLYRPGLLESLRTELLEVPNIGEISLTPRIHALHGMGGIGKSVAARAVCDDSDIQSAFPDGILWVTVGKTPNIVLLLHEIITALGGSINEASPSIEKLKDNLAKLLRDRICLFILDDVWRRSHAESLIVGGRQCSYMITTRDAEIARQLGAHVFSVPLMEQDQALALLDDWADISFQVVEHTIKISIVNRLEFLPLAIKLAGAQLRYKKPDLWLKTFDAHKLTSRRVENVHDSLGATFALSLDDLDTPTRNLYMTLGTFLRDEKIPRTAIGRLWSQLNDLTSQEIDEIIYDLNSRALLQLSGLQPYNKLNDEIVEPSYAITLHSLLRDFIVNELTDTLRIRSHQAILESYKINSVSDNWPEIPDDGYLYDHLTYHLDQIFDQDNIARNDLVQLFDNPRWLLARLAQSSYKFSGFLTDLMIVWTRVHKEVHSQLKNHGVAPAIANSVRYALIHTSINSLASDHIPQLVLRALELGIWSIERCLDLIQYVHTPLNKVNLISVVLGTNQLHHLQQEDMLKIGIETANSIKNDRVWFDAFMSLFPHLQIEDKSDVQSKLIEILLTIQDLDRQIQATKSLAHHLIDGEKDRITGLLLEKIFAIVDDQALTQRLLHLASVLNHKQLSKVVELAQRQNSDEVFRVKLMIGLLPYLVDDQKYPIFQQVLQNVFSLQTGAFKAQLLIDLIQYSDDVTRRELQELALQVTLAIDDAFFRTQLLARLCKYLSGDTKEFAINTALGASGEIKSNWPLAKASIELLPHLHEHEKHVVTMKALEATFLIRDDWYRAQALVGLAHVLDGDQRDAIQNKALDAVLVLEHQMEKNELLAEVVQLLDATGVRRGLEATRISESPQFHRRAIDSLIGYLTVEGLQSLFEAARSILESDSRTRGLRIVADYLPRIAKDSSLTKTAKGETYLRGSSMVRLTPIVYVDEDNLQTEIARGKSLTDDLFLMTISNPEIAYKFKGSLQDIIQQILSIEDEKIRADALISLLPRLQSQDLNLLLGATLTITNRRLRAETLGRLISSWPEELSSLLYVIRSTIADHLFWDIRNEPRSYLLDFFSSSRLFVTPVLQEDVLGMILAQIVEICEIWEW